MNWHDYFTYDETTGDLIWKERASSSFSTGNVFKRWGGKHFGKIAGHKDASGYVKIKVNGRPYRAHRIIVEMHDGPLSAGEQVDHIDGVRSNNRRINLRRCSQSQNKMNAPRHRNNTSGYKGVSYHAASGKWLAQIIANGSHKYLGLFLTAQEAHAAYCAAAKELHGDFANTSAQTVQPRSKDRRLRWTESIQAPKKR